MLHDIVRFTEEVSATVQNFDTRITQVEATHNDAQEDTLHNYGQVQALRELNQVHVSHDAQVESTFDNVHDSFTRNLDQAQAEATHNQAQEQATLESAQLDATYSHAPLPVTPSHRTGLLGTPKSALRMPGVHSQSSASDALASPTPRPRRVGKPVMEDAILNGTASGSIKKARSRKKLHIKIPGDAKLNIPADGLPTPLTLISVSSHPNDNSNSQAKFLTVFIGGNVYCLSQWSPSHTIDPNNARHTWSHWSTTGSYAYYQTKTP